MATYHICQNQTISELWYKRFVQLPYDRPSGLFSDTLDEKRI
jgi:hypothetical protein